MRLILRRACVSVLLAAALASPLHGQTDDTPSLETVARIVRLLESSGHQYSKLSPNLWSITFKGKQKESVAVLLLSEKQQLVFFGAIVNAAEIDDSAPALRTLLSANANLPEGVHVMPYEDTYVVLTREPLNDLKADSFDDVVLTVANAIDETFGQVTKALSATPSARAGASLATGRSVRVRPRTASQQVELLSGRAELAFDPSIWTETKSDEPGKRTFQHRKGDGYAMVIAERIEIPLDRWKEIAVANAQKAAQQVSVVEERRIQVNGTDVMVMRMDLNAAGVPLAWLGYYYGGPAGAVQVVTYTGRNLLDEYRRDFEDFLNGFRVR